MNSDALHRAARCLADGGLVAFPTETVYGLGARADDDAAVAAIFAAKGRPAEHPLIVHLADATDAARFGRDISPAAQRLMAAFWPGPLTLILRRRAGMAAAAAGGQDSIGLRVPSHPMARALLRACAVLGVAGVAAPSANRFGRVSPTTAAHVRQEFGPELLVLDGGACEVGIESTIVDCSGEQPVLLRPGQLSRLAIETVLAMPLAMPHAASPRASGTLASHYAPAVPLRLLTTQALQRALQARPADAGQGSTAKRVAVYSRTHWTTANGPAPDLAWCLFKTMPTDPAAAAHELFAALRELESAHVEAIWVEQPPDDAAWDGVRDRLGRAAA